MRFVPVLIVMLCFCFPVSADDYTDEYENLSGYQGIVDYYDSEVKGYLEENGLEFNLDSLTDSIYKRDFKFSPGGIIDGILGLLSGCLKENFSAIGIIMMLSVLSGFMTNIVSLGNNEGGSRAAFYIIFCVICGICINAFVKSIENGIGAIAMMSNFVKISAPALLTLTAASGQAVTAAVFSPVLYSVAAVAVSASDGILIPLVYSTFSLSAVGCVGDGVNLERMVRLTKNITKWVMGFFLTVFSAMATVGNVASGSVNAIASRTAKFAVGNFIPLVGGMLADSIDMIVSCARIVRSAVGTGITVVIILVFAVCGIQLVAQLWLFRIAAAFTSAVADPGIIKFIDDIADCISMVFSVLCMCAFLFLIIITFMISGSAV